MSNSISPQNETFGQSESTQAFAKLPKVLITEPQYKHLTAQHILAYTLMRDRLQLSISKQMKDKDGTPFIYYDLRKMAAAVRCGEKKADQLVNDLDNMGLIRKVRQGLGKPNRIYVFEADQSKRLAGTRSEDGQELLKEQLKAVGRTCLTRPTDGQEPSSGQSNKTEISKTDNSKTKISKTDNSNYSVNGNERAFGLGGLDGILTSNAKDYLLARNEESLVDEVSTLLYELVATPSRYAHIDDALTSGYALSQHLGNISVKQVQTALNHVKGNQYSEEERRDHLISALYHAVDQTSNTDTLAEISKETQERNKKTLDQMCAEMSDFWSKPCSFTD